MTMGKMSIRGRDETMSIESSVCGDEMTFRDTEGSNGEEKIFVSVRMRPLNNREIARNDICDWECIDDNTIVFKGSMPDRSIASTPYTLDRVFGSECSTKQVYEEGAKEIAIASVSGINSTIFAYGQTCSGKTYTMTGITEYAVKDIYACMEQHKEREFVLKFSAMEIYNEAVRDLLSSDSNPLRVRDDPEKGIIVEKLLEETLIDWNHLQELISICEAQRQIGETNMNESSSRSHQILRLTVESSPREYSGAGNSILTATVNFVDLAGSERNSQTLAVGTRLKEGSHINRSLLTLGTVIRKLSTGGNGHIPYRESKLTRILQNSLGGNARTAMICTISPSSYHIEQSRNTLLFASCAKEVSTNARVNVVMSDKVLVKQLRKDVARLETQLRSMRSISVAGDTAALVRQKDLLIEQMDKEIKELTWQRDIANSRFETLLRSIGEERLSRVDENSVSEASQVINYLRMNAGLARSSTLDFDSQTVQTLDPEDSSILDGNILNHGWDKISEANNEETEGSCKEVRCVACMNSKPNEENMATTKALNTDGLPSTQEDKELNHSNSFNSSDALKRKVQELHETISRLEQFSNSEAGPSSLKGLTLARSKSKKTVVMTIPSAFLSEKEEETEMTLPAPSDDPERSAGIEPKLPESEPKLLESEPKLPESVHDAKTEEVNNTSASTEEESVKEIDIHVDDTTVIDFNAEENKMAESPSELQIGDVQVPETSTQIGEEGGSNARQRRSHSALKFQRYRKKIVELWVKCNVSLVHRSYFYLLFKGEPSDNVYMEVELRRLYFLKETSTRGTNSMIDTQIVSPASSIKSLVREREFLARQLQKKYTKRERDELYQSWGIDLETKQRSLQLARMLWTDTKDANHMLESSVLVVKLVGLVEPRYAPKEMFGLSFLTPSTIQKSSSWRDNMSSLL
ncbi:kinesin-like protein KIN-7G [Euphorbia lathyris]|uniref:kinesin-like protein KIN-7G n=1 Tax=Euphorbia lathyris TaxID=212925 RepID=UPI003313FB24